MPIDVHSLEKKNALSIRRKKRLDHLDSSYRASRRNEHEGLGRRKKRKKEEEGYTVHVFGFVFIQKCDYFMGKYSPRFGYRHSDR